MSRYRDFKVLAIEQKSTSQWKDVFVTKRSQLLSWEILEAALFHCCCHRYSLKAKPSHSRYLNGLFRL